MTYHDLPRALLAHLGFTAVSVFFGFVLGVAFGILLSRRPRLSGVVHACSSIVHVHRFHTSSRSGTPSCTLA